MSWEPRQSRSVVPASYTRVIVDHGCKLRNVSKLEMWKSLWLRQDFRPQDVNALSASPDTVVEKFHDEGKCIHPEFLPSLVICSVLEVLTARVSSIFVQNKAQRTRASLPAPPYSTHSLAWRHLHQQPANIRGPCSTPLPHPPQSGHFHLFF